MFLSKLISIVLLGIIYQSTASEWNYEEEGPDVWSDINPACAGHAQSPINIRTACTVHRSFKPFQFSEAYYSTQSFNLINTGHTISATYTGDDPALYSLTGGGLDGTYQFSSLHIHWGPNYKSGSEHQVNGGKYSSELHIIHKNPTTGEAAVLGMFIQSTKEANAASGGRRKRNATTTESERTATWEKFLSVANQLNQINDSDTVELRLASLFTGDVTKFWRYTGSLTTPPCTEGIIWTVFKDAINVNDNQFQQLRSNVYLEDFREPQPIYNRLVYRSYLLESISSIADYVCCAIKK